MQLGELLVALIVTVFASWAIARGIAARPASARSRPNYRGVRLSPFLGLAVVVPTIWVLGWTLASRWVAGTWRSDLWAYLWCLAALAAVCIAGLVDDLSGATVRGLRGHLRESLRGRPTTGSIKVLAGVTAGAVVVLALPHRGWFTMLAGVVLMAGAMNVANGLDVGPGRTGRVFLLLGAPLPFLSGDPAPRALLFVMWFAAVPAVLADLRERAMLGDNGANPMGFAIGAAAYAVLPPTGVWVAAGIAVALNVVAETTSFSRIIRRSAPLRWFDQLGTTEHWRRFSGQRATRRRRL